MSASIPQRLEALRKLKTTAAAKSAASKAANAEFKQAEARTYAAMDAAGVESMKVKGLLFSTVEKVDGYVEDRAEFVDWALRQDTAIADFIDAWMPPSGGSDFIEALFDAITSTELVTYKENGDNLNQIARAHIDDGAPLPPGANFRPKNYISQRKS